MFIRTLCILLIFYWSIPIREGFVIGHEPMGIVEEVGPEVTKVKKGDRVVIPFNAIVVD